MVGPSSTAGAKSDVEHNATGLLRTLTGALPTTLNLRQNFVDDDVFFRGLAECGIQPLQQVRYGFGFSADQSNARLFADGGQCRASDRRDFTDGDLTAGLIEEGLDVLEAVISRGDAC
jgi:hypothetical protein